GTIGYFLWPPIRPGYMLLQQIAPAGLGCLALLITVVFWLGRGLHRTSLTLLDSQAQLIPTFRRREIQSLEPRMMADTFGSFSIDELDRDGDELL
ncbi:hypothetical protein ACC764_38145, partial [Rhizobium ruizarguesonis]